MEHCTHNCKILGSIPRVSIYLSLRKSGGAVSPFFPMAHHEYNLQRQGYIANLVHKKCSAQNYKRGGVSLGGSKVGWVGPKLGGWVLSKITPPLINEACSCSLVGVVALDANPWVACHSNLMSMGVR